MEDSSPLQILNQTSIVLPFEESEAQTLITEIEKDQKCSFSSVELVYVDEEEIVRINNEFLQHDYITDIITFRYDEDESNSEIEGSLVCCAPRIKEQAAEFNQTEKQEFLRIIVHGLLHLVGYDDQSDAEKTEMTRLEDRFLASLSL
ncbi:MAG: rRNA maturation RNase YbeY [Balneolaceae bacterium]